MSHYEMNIDRSSFHHSSVHNGPRIDGSAGGAAELRRLLHDHRAELVALAGTRGSRVEGRLDEIDEELQAPETDQPAVRSAWASVLKVLEGGAAAAGSVSKITELVRSLFGA